MFGYVLPMREEMKVREWERFRSIYCGLCHTLKRRYGWTGSFLLYYDFVFLAMLLGADGETACKRCMAHPIRGRSRCSGCSALDAAADKGMILTWWKLQDQLADEKAPHKRLAARLLCLVYQGSYRKAAALCPAFDELVRRRLSDLQQLERDGCDSIDRTADAFAAILEGAGPDTGTEAVNRIYRQLLYHVGRWIYLVDARDDLKEDFSSGQYNPIIRRFGLEQVETIPTQVDTLLEGTLNQSLNLALSAFDLLHEDKNSPIVENILCLGLPLVQKLVFEGKWKQQKKMLQETKK